MYADFFCLDCLEMFTFSIQCMVPRCATFIFLSLRDLFSDTSEVLKVNRKRSICLGDAKHMLHVQPDIDIIQRQLSSMGVQNPFGECLLYCFEREPVRLCNFCAVMISRC